MRKLVAVVYFLVLFLPVFSQSGNRDLGGKVQDNNGNPVRAVSVVLMNTERGTVTNEKGEFFLRAVPYGSYDISFSAIGFASRIIATSINSSTTTLAVTLSPSYQLLDELLVSAEKTEEKLQGVAGSVTAISARQVREFRLWDIKDVTAIVPNLYSASPGDYRNVTSIRGVTTTSYEQAVATYVDGVNQFNLDTYIPQLLDIERIEVLRGPQGTLYGRNAMGGVINIITRKPSDRPELYAEVNLGNFGQQRYIASVKAPIVKQKLYIGAALLYDKRNGYYTNEFSGSDFDRQHQLTGNYYLRYLPNGKFSATLNVKHQNNSNNGPFPLSPDKTSALENPFRLNQNAITTMKDDVFNTSLSLNYATAGVRFQSLTSWQSNYRIYKEPIDGDFSPLDAISIVNNYGKEFNKVRVFTQEFRLQSRDQEKQKLKWTTGAFFFHQDNPVKQGTRFGNDAPLLGIPDSNFTLVNTNLGTNTGFALYGQVNYKLSDRLALIAGLRYDNERRKLTVSGEYQKDQYVIPTQNDSSASANFNALSPKAGLDFTIAEDHHLYLTYSRGYRAGGFTTLGSDPSQVPLAGFDPEYSNNVELGWKNFYLARKLKINATLFYTFVNNVQTPTLILPDAVTVVRNAGKLNSKGVELEISANPAKGLEFILNGGITDASFTELKIPKDGQEVDYSGNKQIFTPSYTTLAVAQYTYPLKSMIHLTARLEAKFLGKQYFDLANAISQESYGLLNARLSLSFQKAELYVWGRNLANKTYLAYGYDFGGVYLGNPRTYGIGVSIKL